ncbi:MAG: hypothetical protein WCD43_01275, partial [Candidatus Acidiferrales bacterium]
MKRATLWIVFVVLCALGNAACGSSPKPLAVAITVAPTTLAVSTSGSVIAVVTNAAAANTGVAWTCTPALSCGTFSFAPNATASGASATFTAPPIVPAG